MILMVTIIYDLDLRMSMTILEISTIIGMLYESYADCEIRNYKMIQDPPKNTVNRDVTVNIAGDTPNGYVMDMLN